jgi:putative acyl-CoA dehydrogenase
MAKNPASVESFFAELEEARGTDAHLDTAAEELREELADLDAIEARARRVVEWMALVLQGSLLRRFGDQAVADAFSSSRLGGDAGRAFGTLPAGTDFGRIIDRHAPGV